MHEHDRAGGARGPSVPHKGVDAQSWGSFEQQVRARRFHTLLRQAAAARAAGDQNSSNRALDEARELCPDAVELQVFEAAPAARPDAAFVASPHVASVAPPDNGSTPERPFGQRLSGALLLLAIGVGLHAGFEWRRWMTSTTSPQTSAIENRVPLQLVSPTVAPGVEPVTEQVDLPVPDITRTSEASPPMTPTAHLAVSSSRRPSPPSRGRVADTRQISPTRRSNAAALPQVARATRLPAPPSAPAPAAPAPAAVAATAEPAEPAAPAPVPAHAPATGAAARVPVTAPAAVTDSAESPAALPERTDESLVADVLRRYADAYGSLNAEAAREVWPSVNERALARAFDNLASQKVSLDDCDIAVRGATANASCRGEMSYVGKVGAGERRTEPRKWQFELRRDGDAWKIQRAVAQSAGATHD